MYMHKCGGRLCIWSFGLAFGIVKALWLFGMGLAAMHFGWGTKMVDALSEMYIGYGPTLMGSVYGALEGFVVAFISGVLIAGFYNLFCCACRSVECTSAGCKTEPKL